MHVRLIAVGDRQPAWVDSACSTYVSRLPPHWKFRSDIIAPGKRNKNSNKAAAMQEEGRRVLAALKPGEFAVLLDERGTLLTSVEFSDKLSDWQSAGRDLSFVIGGPDGVSNECSARADYRWSLSRLTLPHGLARVLFTEQLYRAWSLTEGHPYHRN